MENRPVGGAAARIEGHPADETTKAADGHDFDMVDEFSKPDDTAQRLLTRLAVAAGDKVDTAQIFSVADGLEKSKSALTPEQYGAVKNGIANVLSHVDPESYPDAKTLARALQLRDPSSFTHEELVKLDTKLKQLKPLVLKSRAWREAAEQIRRHVVLNDLSKMNGGIRTENLDAMMTSLKNGELLKQLGIYLQTSQNQIKIGDISGFRQATEEMSMALAEHPQLMMEVACLLTRYDLGGSGNTQFNTDTISDSTMGRYMANVTAEQKLEREDLERKTRHDGYKNFVTKVTGLENPVFLEVNGVHYDALAQWKGGFPKIERVLSMAEGNKVRVGVVPFEFAPTKESAEEVMALLQKVSNLPKNYTAQERETAIKNLTGSDILKKACDDFAANCNKMIERMGAEMFNIGNVYGSGETQRLVKLNDPLGYHDV